MMKQAASDVRQKHSTGGFALSVNRMCDFQTDPSQKS
jgi:hypothetical protein